MSTRVCAVVLVLSLSAAGCAKSAAQIGLPAGEELSDETTDALNDAFGDWQLAPVDPQGVACFTADGGPTRLVRGDINSDGRPDVALAVKAADGVHLVAVLQRTNESTLIDIDSLGTDAADGLLKMEPQGRAYRKAGSVEDYFAADTVAVYRCGQPPTVYFWSGTGFQKQALSGAAAGPGLPGLPQHPL